jgi:hypothetical protein
MLRLILVELRKVKRMMILIHSVFLIIYTLALGPLFWGAERRGVSVLGAILLLLVLGQVLAGAVPTRRALGRIPRGDSSRETLLFIAVGGPLLAVVEAIAFFALETGC